MYNGEQTYQSLYKENNQTLPLNELSYVRNRGLYSEYKHERYLPNNHEQKRYHFSHTPLNKSLSHIRAHRNQENSENYETRNNPRSSVNLNKRCYGQLDTRKVSPYEGVSSNLEIVRGNNERIGLSNYIPSTSSQKYLTLPIERMERKQGKIYANRFHQEQERFEGKNFDDSNINIEEIRETRIRIENEKKKGERLLARNDREEIRKENRFVHADNRVENFHSMTTSSFKSQSQSRFYETQHECPETSLTPNRQERLVQPAESVYSISKREAIQGSELSPICFNKMNFSSKTPNREKEKNVCLDNSAQSRKQELIEKSKNLREKMNSVSIDKNRCDFRYSGENKKVGEISLEEMERNKERLNRIQEIKNRQYSSSFEENKYELLRTEEKERIEFPERFVMKEQGLVKGRNNNSFGERIQNYSPIKPYENNYLNRINALNIKINDKINAIKNAYM